MSGRLVLVGGGVRSGKSAFALARARELGERRVLCATAEPRDDEMRARIAAHQRERGDAFRTLEAPLALPSALAQLKDADVVVVDCLTLWLSNLLLRGDMPAMIARQVEQLCEAIRGRSFHTVIVSNEVGMGVVPESPLGRAFRDVSGLAHQRLARSADEVFLAVMGCVLRLRPEPVAVSAGGLHANVG